eukprot:m.29338 g.29338  ORF g.29338 m.29338 type:complete len:53 (-) comp16077_c1_seq1:1601-1759(-)
MCEQNVSTKLRLGSIQHEKLLKISDSIGLIVENATHNDEKEGPGRTSKHIQN